MFNCEEFRCEQCGKLTRQKEKVTKCILKKLPKYYDNGDDGWKIVKKISICESCANAEGLAQPVDRESRHIYPRPTSFYKNRS